MWISLSNWHRKVRISWPVGSDLVRFYDFLHVPDRRWNLISPNAAYMGNFRSFGKHSWWFRCFTGFQSSHLSFRVLPFSYCTQSKFVNQMQTNEVSVGLASSIVQCHVKIANQLSSGGRLQTFVTVLQLCLPGYRNFFQAFQWQFLQITSFHGSQYESVWLLKGREHVLWNGEIILPLLNKVQFPQVVCEEKGVTKQQSEQKFSKNAITFDGPDLFCNLICLTYRGSVDFFATRTSFCKSFVELQECSDIVLEDQHITSL